MATSISPRIQARPRTPLGLGILACILGIIGLGQALRSADTKSEVSAFRADGMKRASPAGASRAGEAP